MSRPPAVAHVEDSFGLDLLDISPPSPVAPKQPQISQLQQQFNNSNQNAFNSAGDSDPFGAPQNGGETFDAWGSPPPQQNNGNQQQGTFDAFNTQPQQGGFGDFSTSFPSQGQGQSPQAMSFIKVAPPTAAEKAAEDAKIALAIANRPPPPKNFNVFDELHIPPPMHHGYGPPQGYPGGPPNPYGPPQGYPGGPPGPQGNDMQIYITYCTYVYSII